MARRKKLTKAKPAFTDTPQSLAERTFLLEFARFARGDPLLTAFEENFAVSMERLGQTPNGPLPSEKQRVILEQIAQKIGFGCEPASVPTDDDACDEEDATELQAHDDEFDLEWP